MILRALLFNILFFGHAALTLLFGWALIWLPNARYRRYIALWARFANFLVRRLLGLVARGAPPRTSCASAAPFSHAARPQTKKKTTPPRRALRAPDADCPRTPPARTQKHERATNPKAYVFGKALKNI